MLFHQCKPLRAESPKVSLKIPLGCGFAARVGVALKGEKLGVENGNPFKLKSWFRKLWQRDYLEFCFPYGYFLF